MHYARCIVHYHLRGAFTRGALREVHYAFTGGAFTRCIYITASRRARARRENFMSSISIPSDLSFNSLGSLRTLERRT